MKSKQIIIKYTLFVLFIILFSKLSWAGCTAPDGSPMIAGDSLTLFKTEYKPEGSDCESVDRVCESDGTITGDPAAIYISCLDEKTCEHPFLPDRLTDGQTVVAYKAPEKPCVQETRVCDGNSGVLSGSFLHNFCK